MPGQEWQRFVCKVKQELFMGDMAQPSGVGLPDCFVDVFDMTYLISHLFEGMGPPTPASAADIDCDGFATAIDLATLISYLFEGSDPPPYCDAK
jgi:hypothetical protein